jgi:pyruvoyl-dependent arginine decarboxylase (PvlArgDC)
MKAIYVLTIISLLGVIIAVSVTKETEYITEYIEVPKPSLNDEVAQRADEMMNSELFKEEMRVTAVARTLYFMSIERQDVAVELSEMAVMSNKRAEELASKWHAKVTNTNYDGSI